MSRFLDLFHPESRTPSFTPKASKDMESFFQQELQEFMGKWKVTKQNHMDGVQKLSGRANLPIVKAETSVHLWEAGPIAFSLN